MRVASGSSSSPFVVLTKTVFLESLGNVLSSSSRLDSLGQATEKIEVRSLGPCGIGVPVRTSTLEATLAKALTAFHLIDLCPPFIL
jgi:hypothetical protein